MQAKSMQAKLRLIPHHSFYKGVWEKGKGKREKGKGKREKGTKR
jgi:hypothetical protein